MPPRLFVCLALCVPTALGHVKLFYSDSSQALGNRPIRNANAPTADGSFSVSGPCGGGQAYGANGVSEMQKGGVITAKINYNGGHKSEANEFRVAFACGRLAESAFRDGTYDLSASQCAPGAALCPTTGTGTGGPYPCPAPQGNTVSQGYIFQCTLPTIDPTTGQPWASDDCTLSVLEQRNWGGCLDLTMTASTVPAEEPVVADSTGLYVVQPAQMSDWTTDCCVDAGTIEVAGTPSSTTANAQLSNFRITCTDGTSEAVPSVTLQLVQDDAGSTYRTTLTLRGQEFELSVNNGAVQLQNIDAASPTVCDPTISQTRAGNGLGSGSSGSKSSGNGKAIAGSVTVLFLGAAVVVHIFWVERRQNVPKAIVKEMDKPVQMQARVMAAVSIVFWLILLICLATMDWIHTTKFPVDDCQIGLTKYSCDKYDRSGGLEDDMKDAGDTMAGCGAMAFLALTGLCAISGLLAIGKDFSMPKQLATVGLVLCGVFWLFLTAGWTNYATVDGGIQNWEAAGAEYGASFGFTVFLWVLFLVYIMKWRALHLKTTTGSNATDAFSAPPTRKTIDTPTEMPAIVTATPVPEAAAPPVYPGPPPQMAKPVV